MAYQLTVAGLGPAGAELMTRGTWAHIEAAEQILLRTHSSDGGGIGCGGDFL